MALGNKIKFNLSKNEIALVIGLIRETIFLIDTDPSEKVLIQTADVVCNYLKYELDTLLCKMHNSAKFSSLYQTTEKCPSVSMKVHLACALFDACHNIHDLDRLKGQLNSVIKEYHRTAQNGQVYH